MTFWCERLWSPGAGLRTGVLVLPDTAGRIGSLTPADRPPPGVPVLPGLVLPGLANAHSHAFHRALRGRTHAGAGDFWAWRERMYAVARALDPDSYRDLARAAYAEMALAGITLVGEFHYLHHGPHGVAYGEPNVMAGALVDAAAEAGVRLTLLDACYLQADVDGTPLSGVQRRFGDRDAEAWAERVSALVATPSVRIGAAVHSVRAVAPAAMATVAGWARAAGAPLHLHLSEQPRENAACRAVHGCTPAELADRAGVLGPGSTAVHATHLTGTDVALLGRTRTTVCLCPTTERDLADGVGPASALAAAGSRLCLGSDSQAVVDLFEEARGVENGERLLTLRRGSHRPADLLAAATAGGADALGWPDAGRVEPGAWCDLVAVDLASVRTAGGQDHPVACAVFAATAADVTDVVVAGRPVVRDRRHLRVGDVGRTLAGAINRVDAAVRG